MNKQTKKVGKIQLFGQKEAFYSGNDFAYPHCTYFKSDNKGSD